MNMKLLVVDDEPLARSRLQRLLAEVDGVVVVGEAADGDAALKAVQRLSPDLVLLDIRMPGIDGLEAAAAIAEMPQPPAIIFCTAYDDYAVQAFDAQAVGYLVKPVERSKLATALQRARRLNRAQLASIATLDDAELPGRSHLSASTRRGLERVAIADVRCLLADHKYVAAVHPGGELLLDESLKDLEQEFGGRFVRVHRSALVARAWLRGLERQPDGGFCVRVEGVAQGPAVSRRHLSGVRALLREE